MFRHVSNIDLPWDNLKTKNINGKRHYILPNGTKPLPSVSTVLSALDDGWIHEWRKAVGAEEANRVGRVATRRGTRTHNLIEKHLRNEEIDLSKEMPDSRQGFLLLKKAADKHIQDIVAMEYALGSEFIGMAGRADLIANFDGELSIIDWKTSKRAKRHDEIRGYFMQSTAYSLLFEDMTGIPINQIVVVMCPDTATEPLIFREKPIRWVKKLIEAREIYRKNVFFGKK